MRILDADILSYALYDLSPFNLKCKPLIEKAASGKIELYVTHTTVLETFNVLYWSYKIRPRRAILEKISALLEIVSIVSPSIRGLEIALENNIPLGDGILIATARENKIPVIISNDDHIKKYAPHYGLIIENPLEEK